MAPDVHLVVLDGHTLDPGDNPSDELATIGHLTVYDRTEVEEIVPRALGADIVLTNKTPLASDTLDRLPRLRFISILATGYNVVDIEAARRRGIPVSNVPEYSTDSVAQHTFALILELCQQVGVHASAVREGEWTRKPDFCFWKAPPLELAGLTLGIVGFGKIGRRVAELGRAFRMNVVAATGRAGEAGETAPVRRCTIERIFAESDVVTLHCPLTAGNRQFVNAALIARMKPGAFLINTARGGLVDEHALAAALAAGRLAGAAVDVVSVEPIRADNPLLHAPHCIVTPHMAWGSLAARRRLMAATAENIRAFLAGRPIHVVNAPA